MIHTSTPPQNQGTKEFISEVRPITKLPLQGQLFECEFNPKEYSDLLFKALDVTLSEDVRLARDKRKSEFLAGRYCAQQALNHYGYQNIDIPIGQDRSPQWPKGVIGSITHAGNRAVCAISRQSVGLGIDYELPVTDKTANEISNLIVSEKEKLLLSNSGLPYANWLTLIFSIKESLFKALYPKVKQYFDFLDAEVFSIDHVQQTISLKLLRNLTPEVRSGQIYDGKYCFHQGGILTLIEY
ncbi:hypothetical protein Misp06_00352 [Microbulbifer sp. NBRC 101763]|uniref:4'-phosphopantetheinyl transferase family protein n=1 Tax=Microbulbifer TaxID=48073 RepID=UPI000370B302|nr:4'-phosphopantetheinyl transferase superfamily protein [Microbulbifer variabilis]